MKIVLDTNAALEITGNRPKGQDFAALLLKATEVLAPDLFLIETANALWKLHKFGSLPEADIKFLLQEITDLIGQWKSIQDIYQPALELAIRHGITAYDACYLVLASESHAALLTLDKKMQLVAKSIGVELAWEA